SAAYPTATVSLRGPYGSVFSDDALPVKLDLADFAEVPILRGRVAIGLPPSPNSEDVGRIESLVLVPEPAAGPLAGAATLAALALVARAGSGRARRRER